MKIIQKTFTRNSENITDIVHNFALSTEKCYNFN